MKPAVLLAAGLALQGCGGSGSGSKSRPAYQGYAKIMGGGEEVRAEGRARTASGVGDADTELSNASMVFKVGRESKADVARISIEARGRQTVFDVAEADTVGQTGNPNVMVPDVDGVLGAVSLDRNSGGYFSRPGANDLEYTSFGAWMNNVGPGGDTRGAGAFGVETLASDIPNVGSANYSGASASTYIDENGERYLTRSKFKVSANFRSGKVDMGTIDTQMRSATAYSDQTVENPVLNFIGTGNIRDRTRIEATLQGNGGFGGAAEGRFYGPDGKEVGGTFEMRGPRGTYVGAFGAEGGLLDPAAKPGSPGASSPVTGRDFIDSLNVGLQNQ